MAGNIDAMSLAASSAFMPILVSRLYVTAQDASEIWLSIRCRMTSLSPLYLLSPSSFFAWSMRRRRASQEPVENGGWSVFITSAASVEYTNPAAHLGLRSDGAAAWVGWPTDRRMEVLRRGFMFAPDGSSRKRIAAEIEQEGFTAVP
jgi:hypothetical protein